MWYGEYLHTIDDKMRFVLPAKFREIVKALPEKNFYMTRGLEGCLVLYHRDVWVQLEEKLKSLNSTKREARFFNRLFFSGAQQIAIDVQGRVGIPDYLREFAQISREVMIIGVADRIEIWDKGRWETFYQENKARFEEVAENIFE